MNYASVEMFPNNFVVTVFDENGIFVDSFSFMNFESNDSVKRSLEEIADKYDIKRWVSSQERKIAFERNPNILYYSQDRKKAYRKTIRL